MYTPFVPLTTWQFTEVVLRGGIVLWITGIVCLILGCSLSHYEKKPQKITHQAIGYPQQGSRQEARRQHLPALFQVGRRFKPTRFARHSGISWQQAPLGSAEHEDSVLSLPHQLVAQKPVRRSEMVSGDISGTLGISGSQPRHL